MMDMIAWLISFLLNIALMGFILYQLRCLEHLEYDYTNVYDLTSQINRVVLPEFVSQGILCVLHLIFGHWITFLLCLPNMYYNLKRYTEGRHLMDVTEIFNQISGEKKMRFCKLGHTAIMIALSIFWMIAMMSPLYIEEQLQDETYTPKYQQLCKYKVC